MAARTLARRGIRRHPWWGNPYRPTVTPARELPRLPAAPALFGTEASDYMMSEITRERIDELVRLLPVFEGSGAEVRGRILGWIG